MKKKIEKNHLKFYFLMLTNMISQEQYLKRFKEITEQMYKTTEAKNKDYAGEWTNNAFKNFEAVETFWVKTTDWFITRMTDKLMRISNLTRQNNHVADEKIVDTLIDLWVYSILFKIYLEWNDTR